MLFLFLSAVSIALIVGWVLGRKVLPGSNLSTDSASSWLGAIATLVIAILTFVLASETRELRKAQTEQLKDLRLESIRPNITVQLESSKVGMNFADVKISNLGRGVARKLTFEFLDRQGRIVANDSDPIVREFRKLAVFRLGIESMGIGQTISSYLINFPELLSKLEGKLSNGWLHMVIRYTDIESTPYQNEFVVDFAQFEGISQLGGGDPLHQISTEFKKLRELFERTTSSNRRFNVNVHTSTDRAQEAEDHRRWLEEVHRQDGSAVSPLNAEPPEQEERAPS